MFDFPKPVSLIAYLIRLITGPNDTVLDFFSGSATTAHAVFEVNKLDGGNRRFILVQYPEKLPEDSEAKKQGYDTICDVGVQRIRLAKKEIEDEFDSDSKLDMGFRIFDVDSSNFNDVYYNPRALKKDLLDYAENNIKSDRNGEDLLFQVMIELGIELSAPINKSLIAEKEVFIVDNGYLIACFDENVTDDTVTELAKKKPTYVVFRDSSLADDSVAINFDQIFRAYSPNTKIKVL